MKKNYYLILLLVCISCFTACDNDEKNGETLPPVVQQKEWTEYLSNYGIDRPLIINGAVMVDNYRTVLLEENDQGNARISLCNLVIDTDTLVYQNVEMTKTDNGFSFAEVTTVEDGRIAINGNLIINDSDIPSIILSVNREDISGLANTWKLVYNEEHTSVDLEIRAQGGIAGALGTLLQYFDIGGMVADKLAALNLYFSPDGVMDFGFTTIDAGQEVNIAALLTGLSDDPLLGPVLTNVAQELDIEYLPRSGNTLLIGLNRRGIDPLLSLLTIEGLIPDFDLGNLGIDIDLDIIKSLIAVYPNHYFLPLSYSIEDNYLSVYVEKDFILTVWPMIQPILDNIDLSSFNIIIRGFIRAAIASLPNLLPTAELLEVRLGFTIME